MKKISFIFFSMMVVIACQKEVSGDMENEDENENPSTNCRLTKMVQGTDPNDDTVIVINYDLLGKISKIIYPEDEDTMYAYYDADGRLMEREELGWTDPTEYEYNSAGKLTAVFSGFNKTELEYTADTILTKMTLLSPSPWEVFRYYTPVFDANKNLTVLKEFEKDGTPNGQVNFEYSNILNPFGELAAFNFENHLGIDDLLPFSTRYAISTKYLVKKVSTSNSVIEISYEQDKTTNAVIKSVANYKDLPSGNSRGTATRVYHWECQ